MSRVAPYQLLEARSLALHREVAARLREQPELLERAKERVLDWQATGSVSEPYITAWRERLAAGVDAVVELLEERSERAHDLRQVSPFAGVLDARTRWRVHREARERLERA